LFYQISDFLRDCQNLVLRTKSEIFGFAIKDDGFMVRIVEIAPGIGINISLKLHNYVLAERASLMGALTAVFQ